MIRVRAEAVKNIKNAAEKINNRQVGGAGFPLLIWDVFAGWRECMESRVSKAVATFEEGYNCCQSVFSTYADLFGMDRETALKLSCSMGAGVGRMREVCGTVSAMALLAGLKTGNTDPQNQAAKTANYELVRKLADAFKEEQGAIVCREILGIRGREKSAAPSIRTKEYYKTRPCSRTVACASRIIETLLLPELFGGEAVSGMGTG